MTTPKLPPSRLQPLASGLVFVSLLFLTLPVLIGIQVQPPPMPEGDGPTVIEPPSDPKIEPPPEPEPETIEPPELEPEVEPPPIRMFPDILTGAVDPNAWTTSVDGLIPDEGMIDEIVAWDELTKIPEPIQRPVPQYPPHLKRKRVSGLVEVEFVVTKEGFFQSIRILRTTHSDFADAVSKVLRRWTFHPGEKGGQPVKTRVRMDFPFNTR